MGVFQDAIDIIKKCCKKTSTGMKTTKHLFVSNERVQGVNPLKKHISIDESKV